MLLKKNQQDLEQKSTRKGRQGTMNHTMSTDGIHGLQPKKKSLKSHAPKTRNCRPVQNADSDAAGVTQLCQAKRFAWAPNNYSSALEAMEFQDLSFPQDFNFKMLLIAAYRNWN